MGICRSSALNFLRRPAILGIPSWGIFRSRAFMLRRTTRIAVTASLFIAMMIQPVSVFALPSRCNSSSIEQELTCQGCGCCSVEQAGERCCCCSHDVDTDASDDSAKPEAITSFTTAQSPSVCHCGVSSPPMIPTDHRSQVLRDLTLRTLLIHWIELIDHAPPLSLALLVDETLGSRADFAQRILCVWRI